MDGRQDRRVGRRKPCSVCGTWFTPDARVGGRQKTCSEACRGERKRAQRRAFAKANPHYWVERRLAAKVERIKDGTSPPIMGPRPPALQQVPGEYVQSEMGPEALVILEELGRVLLKAMQSEMAEKLAELKAEIGEVLSGRPQSEIAPGVPPP